MRVEGKTFRNGCFEKLPRMFAIKSRAENWAAMPNATLETSDPKARLLSLFDHLNKTIFFNVDMRYKAVQGGTTRQNIRNQCGTMQQRI